VALDIPVTKDYRVTSDSRNIIVNRRYIVDPTKAPNWPKRQAEGASPEPREEWREETFFRTVDQALKYIVDQQVRDSDADSLSELLHEIRRFNREISDVMRKVV
jgi:hypothetical protein